MPTIRSDDATLYYEHHRAHPPASGAPLFFIMGHGADLEAWRPQIDHFGRRRDLIVYDHRGVGRSPRPRLPRYGIRRLADDAARLLESVGAARAHVVGISLGGLVGQQLAIHHPARVASLTLAATYAKPARHLGANIAGIIGRAAWELARTSVRRADPLERETDAFMRSWAPAVFSAPFLRAHEDLVRREIRRTLLVNRRADVALLQLVHILRYDARADLGRIRAPTWIVSGALDRHVPVSLARELAAGIPGARLDVWDDVGHGLTLEAADRFNESLERFVARVESLSARS